MADAEGLQQRPEAVADVEEQQADAGSVDQREEGIVQNFGDEVGNGFDFGFLYKVEIGQVDQDKEKDGDAGIGHGFGADGATAGTGFYLVFTATGLAVLQEQDDAGNSMQEKDGVQADFKNRHKDA